MLKLVVISVLWKHIKKQHIKNQQRIQVWVIHVHDEFSFFTEFCCVILCWVLQSYCIDTLKIILTRFKILKLMTINIFWKYSRKTNEKKLVNNPNQTVHDNMMLN